MAEFGLSSWGGAKQRMIQFMGGQSKDDKILTLPAL